VVILPFLQAASDVVGPTHVLTEVADTAPYAVDWTRRWQGSAAAVVRPGSVEQVAAVVALAREHGVPLVPQGGNTGLVGGGVPMAGEVVVSLRRLCSISPVDRLAGQVTAGAGATLTSVQTAAAAAGWAFGVDLAARDSATVGGMVGTNAGGLHVVRHGAMRAQLVGVEAVLGTGAVVQRLTGLVKDNTGYDLAQLLCGSEGTLGIVTRARLRLVAPPGPMAVALLGLPTMEVAVALAAELRVSLPGVRALEGMTGPSLRRVAEHLGLPVPTDPDAGAYLLVEAEGGDRDEEAAMILADALAAVAALVPGTESALDTAAVAMTEGERLRLWRFREAHSEAAAALGVVHKLDVTLPTVALAGFCDDVVEAVAKEWPDAVTLVFGHVGDGNVHVNVVGADDPSGGAVDDLVLGRVVDRGGSISAEHGIGVAKKAWIARDRSATEIDAMRAVKAALDPDSILNPNALLP
jgi:FAD/FMN-containing dehydrogenase